MPEYVVGIDLGTTNTVVHYMNVSEENPQVEIFNVTQTTEQGEYAELPSLPSYIYLPDGNEVPEGCFELPWQEDAQNSVGAFAKKNAASLPSKIVSSAKSWLCAENVERLDPILPWNRNNPERQLSPLEASQLILEHVRNAWNHTMADDVDEQLENQNVVLTVPASFDAVARELTVEAAKEAGLVDVVLLEEPLAAFYSWLNANDDNWRDQVEPGDVILVCDIGGGTTDFSMIRAVDSDGQLELERVAVGNHLLLGGDNMDLTLAYVAANKLKQEKGMTLDNYQISGLVHACRQAKEVLLSDDNAEPQPLTVLGRGSSLIGGSITTELTREDVQQVLLEGFFPKCQLGEPLKRNARGGLRQFGLAYESDPAVTKHLSQFILNNAEECLPNVILFNGGVIKSSTVRNRIVETVQSWLDAGSAPIRLIEGVNPDCAVSEGGCAYSRVRSGGGIKVKAGSAHTYYIGIESAMPAIPGFEPPVQALCVVPFGMEEGSESDIPYTGLGLIVGDVSEFRFFVSASRHEDELGTVIVDVAGHEDIIELPAMVAELPADENLTPGTMVPVNLLSELNEVGTLQLWCVQNEDNKWKLELDIREH